MKQSSENKRLSPLPVTVDGLSVMKGGKSLIKDISFTLAPGELCIVLGPNGAGKTTLLRAISGLEPLASGQSHLGAQIIANMPPMARARHIAYLPQMRRLAWPARVSDIVSLGRFAYGGHLAQLRPDDQAAVDKAIIDCDLLHLKTRRADSLSGGELARLHCARAFAANAPILIADEPVASLDPQHQFRILGLIRKFVDSGGSALVVLHDINLAARYADRLLWMKDGKLIADGPPKTSLTAARLAEIYGIEAQISGADVLLRGRID